MAPGAGKGRHIDSRHLSVNARGMDLDDLPRRKDDPLVLLMREDLDRLSVEELRKRIAALEAELQRTHAKLEGATNFRSAADALFKKG